MCESQCTRGVGCPWGRHAETDILNNKTKKSHCGYPKLSPSRDSNKTKKVSWGGDVAQLVEYRTGTPPTQVRFPGAARDFSPRVNFQCRLSDGVRTPQCPIACIYICAHVKDPVVRVRVWWIMETLKHPASTIGWEGRLCRSWLSPGKATRNSHGRNPIGTTQL